MKDLNLFLTTIAEGLKLLSKGIESIAETVDAFAEAQREEKPKEKPPAEPTLKAPARPAEKKVAMKAGKEKSPTSADVVIGFIVRSRKGVDTAVLVKKTGFNEKKVRNVIYKLKKQGKVKSEKRGLYLKA